MKNLLAKENAKTLSSLAQSRALLAFDFDGTLAPIVAERDQAQMRRETAVLLGALCALYPCAVVSGRAREDVDGKLGSAAVKYVMGNHGLEPGTHLLHYEREMRHVRRVIASALMGVPGVDVEDKRYSLSLHYRQARRKLETRSSIEQVIAALHLPVRIVDGKDVVNVVPVGAPHKGDALVQLSRIEDSQATLYVGDDVTDEDVFSLGSNPWFQDSNLLGVRIGRSRWSGATYFLRNQQEIDRLLAKLISLRERRLPS